MQRGIRKYFDLKYDYDEIKLRILQRLSRAQHKKNLRFLENIAQSDFIFPPIFIIGPPRSGSTLLYQLLTHRYKFAYLQNQMKPHNYSIAWFTRKHIDPSEKYYSDFKSEHGQTAKPNGPHEGGYFWRRFYPRRIHDYVFEHNLSPQEDFEIINTLKFLSHHFQAPFLSKNMEAGVRLRSIQQLFPKAVYVLVKRDPRAVASSLLNVRLDIYGSKETWWSIRPKEYEELSKLPYYEQLAYQVAYIYKVNFEDIQDAGRLITVQYEDLCENPLATLEALKLELEKKGIGFKDNNPDIPPQFPLRKNFYFTSEELKRIESIFKETGILENVPFVLE